MGFSFVQVHLVCFSDRLISVLSNFFKEKGRKGMFGTYFSTLGFVLVARIFSEELEMLTDTQVEYTCSIKQHERQKNSND